MVPVVTGTRYAAVPFCTRYAEKLEVPLLKLGTKEGNDVLFHREPIAPEEMKLLERLLGGEGVEVVPARFKPDYLPLVLMPDREVMLKERIESDEADRRISSAVLGMARLFTAKVNDDVRARLFVNLDAAPIQRLLLPSTSEAKRVQAGLLLRALSHLLSAQQDTAIDADLSNTLRDYSTAVAAILEEPSAT
jgi:molecular chaperone HtpG